MHRALLVAVLVLGTGAASADPVIPRVITAPTAWLPPAGAIVATGGTDHRGAMMGNAMIGLGGLASLDVGLDTDARGCSACSGDDGDAAPLWLGRAGFRMGVGQDRAFRGAPALVLGLRTTFAAHGHTFGMARVTDAHLVASRMIGPVRVHVGAQVTAAAYADRTVEQEPTLHPLGGIEWTPAIYPRTTVLADIAWVPELRADRTISPEWAAGWGVRYQALRAGSVELAVRHREDEGLSASTVMVRLNVIALPAPHR